MARAGMAADNRGARSAYAVAGPGHLTTPPTRVAALDALTGPVVVACSGGVDSIALLALAVTHGLDVTAVYVDHGTRADGYAEARFVARVAAQLGAKARTEVVHVERGPYFEARARDARYAALERARVALGATAVLVAHTADDQA